MMTRGFHEEQFVAGDVQDINMRRTADHNIAPDPALFGAQASTPVRSQHSRNSHRRRIDQSNSRRSTKRAPGSFPKSRKDLQGVGPDTPARPDMAQANDSDVPETPQIPPSLSPSGYPDSGLIDRAIFRDGVLESSATPETKAATSFLQAQMEVDIPPQKESNSRVIRSSKKRTRADAGLSVDNEDNPEDTTFESQRSTRRSKRTKTTPTYNDIGDEGERKIRKISKLNLRIAEGKAPKTGSLGPKGEVRIREDGRMEFRDVNNPEWTLAAYHNDYRRQFLDEAAEDGEFDHTPVCGEAEHDMTSYEPEQQSWGPSRADWQNIVDSEGEKVMFKFDEPKSRRPQQEPSDWIHDDLVLLDSKNHPVKDWPGLNKTLSTEIESWRWEALMRIYPWLTVADLLARMPHIRKKKGAVLPLQTPQAFTNRAYRFRVPNQIPASNPKNGSKTYKESILKSLDKKGAKTTEGLPILNPDEVDKVRRANKGKFKGNSRYVVNKDLDQETPETTPPSTKRKAHRDGDTQSESEQDPPKAKRPCARTLQSLGVEVPSPNDLIPESIYDDTNRDANVDGAELFDEPTDTAGLWNDREQWGNPIDTTAPWDDQNEEVLVPLFTNIDDKEFALVEDANFTSAYAVIQARKSGNQQTGQIGVCWYKQSTPRHMGADGNMVEDVVDSAYWHQIEAEEPFPNDIQPASQVDSTNDIPPPSTRSNIPPAFHPLFHEPSHEGYQDFLGQNSYTSQPMAISISQMPPPVFNQIRDYQPQWDDSDEVWFSQYGPTGF